MYCDCDGNMWCRYCADRLAGDYAEAVLRLVQAGQDVSDFGIKPRQLVELRCHLERSHEEQLLTRHWVVKTIEGHRPRR